LTGAVFAAALACGGATWATPVLTTLVALNGTNGEGSTAGLIADSAGNLFGTTIRGGTNNYGTAFEVAAGTHALSTLVNFGYTAGYSARAGLIADASGNLYGTTEEGGPGPINTATGTVFEIPAGTHTLSTFATFTTSIGAFPAGGVIADAAGNFYGTTLQGGANGVGTVFKVAADTHAISTLATFNTGNGGYPVAGLIADAAGNLYGTTNVGGANNDGTVFEISAETHALSTLVTFNGNNGAQPHAKLLADAAGNLYGTTFAGGASGYGTVFEIAAGTRALSTLVMFNSSNGANPEAGLIADADGNLYGTTQNGGAKNFGTAFEVAAGTHDISTMATFDFYNGANPLGCLLADAAGNLYGTTLADGPNGAGTVFELTNTGFVTSAPEPAGLSLIGLAGLGLLARRRHFRGE
jgi:uncharacterized repeat protein (TIGR03803 family)